MLVKQLFDDMVVDEELVRVSLKNAHKMPDTLKEEIQRFIIKIAEEAETKGE